MRGLSLCFLLGFVQSEPRNRYFGFQRGDQGPDEDVSYPRYPGEGGGGGVTPAPGGPNVCRSRSSSHCCPGWRMKAFTGLCLTPVCTNNCGSGGKCVKPNICICADGKISPRCSDDSGRLSPAEGGCASTCLNGGTCRDNTCICRSGYAGEYCQEPVCRKKCSNGGRCIGPNRCACVYGYTGRHCEIDYRTGPCYRRVTSDTCTGQLQGVVCTKQLCCATIGQGWGHPCEKCPDKLECDTGFLKNVHTGKCMDINECEAIPGLCYGGQCENNVGSFNCICPDGSVMNDKHECVDEDECQTLGQDTCHRGRCVNTDPGYYCVCEPNFIPTQDRRGCLDGRQGYCYTTFSRQDGQCTNQMQFKLSRIDCCCSRTMGKGWKFNENDLCEQCPSYGTTEYRKLCEVSGIPTDISRNIDECALHPDLCPNGQCVDTEEGYHCQCLPGFETTADGGCRDKNECLQGFCQGGRCRNTEGDFECICPPGFHPSSDKRQCIDHNECRQTGMCSNGNCINMDGTFKCECLSGFKLSQSGLSCVDIDECLENPRICLKGQCKNTPGSYVCVCENGYVHSADGGFCRDMNECSQTGMCDNGQCFNMDGSFKCICDPGYELAPNGKTCEDINECEGNPCQGGRCTNTDGGYQCQCPPGFSLGSDGKTCSDGGVLSLCYAMFSDNQCVNPSLKAVSKSTCCCCSVSFSHRMGWGSPCSPCPAPGSPDYDLLCPHGSGFTHAGDDINECSTQSSNVCEHGACENMAGSYRCLANPGYQVDVTGKLCVDIDECSLDPMLCQGGQCKNTPGSFKCVCPTGTHFNSDTFQVSSVFDETI